MAGYDPAVSREAFRDPGTILSLLGMAMPNITRGIPGQGGYTLRPGKVIEALGDTYSTIKNRQESTKAMQDYAGQASRGTQFADTGGVDPEAAAYTGTYPSEAQRGLNLASFSPPSFGSFVSGASPERLKGLFAGSRGGTELEKALGLPSGQTPFERVFGEIQRGEEKNLQQKRDVA